jgi:hypothetical protein
MFQKLKCLKMRLKKSEIIFFIPYLILLLITIRCWYTFLFSHRFLNSHLVTYETRHIIGLILIIITGIAFLIKRKIGFYCTMVFSFLLLCSFIAITSSIVTRSYFLYYNGSNHLVIPKFQPLGLVLFLSCCLIFIIYQISKRSSKVEL